MAFRVKDLLISIASSADPQECAPPSLDCGCTGHSTPCCGNHTAQRYACYGQGGPYPAGGGGGCGGHSAPCKPNPCWNQGGPFPATGNACGAGLYLPQHLILTPTTMYCPGCSGHSPVHTTTLFWTVWTPWTVCTWISGWPNPDPTIGVEQLAIMKTQLKQELANIEHQEKALEAQLRPKSAEEVEQLEARLRDALKELAKLKTELKRKK
jgi:hypothetical protein